MVMSSFDFFGTDKVGTKIGFITPKKKKMQMILVLSASEYMIH